MTKKEFTKLTEVVDGCWRWLGYVMPSTGYGHMSFCTDKRRSRAHRYAYELFKGPIPKGMVVMHKCDDPLCVNPKHLKVGSQADNLRDMRIKGRDMWAGTTLEERSAISRLRSLAKSQEARSENVRRGHETRKRNKELAA